LVFEQPRARRLEQLQVRARRSFFRTAVGLRSVLTVVACLRFRRRDLRG
jgi:hypothetical protein